MLWEWSGYWCWRELAHLGIGAGEEGELHSLPLGNVGPLHIRRRHHDRCVAGEGRHRKTHCCEHCRELFHAGSPFGLRERQGSDDDRSNFNSARDLGPRLPLKVFAVFDNPMDDVHDLFLY